MANDAKVIPVLLLACKCGFPMMLPLATPLQIIRNRIPNELIIDPQFVACPQCKRVYAYPVGSFHQYLIERTGLGPAWERMATYRLTVLCDEPQCAGLLSTLVIEKKGLKLRDGDRIAKSFSAMNLVCSLGLHKHNKKQFGVRASEFRPLQGNSK